MFAFRAQGYRSFRNLPGSRRSIAVAAAIASAMITAPQGSAQQNISVRLTAEPAQRAVFPGPETLVWTYRGQLLSGPPGTLQEIPGSYLGPIIRVQRGDRIEAELVNGLSEETIIHWHGLDVPALMDGHPREAVSPGGRYLYDFTVPNRAGTYWFHPHPDMRTGAQVAMGLAGVLIVSDEQEQSLPLPRGEYDVPLVIQDRRIDADNQWIYSAPMMGYLGDRILVNGSPDFVLSAATRVYRLRLLNGSNSRIYKLAWGDATPMTVLATDGGLLEAPLQRPYLTLAPGQRAEVWIDLRNREPGTQLILRSLEFTGHGQGGFPTLPQGAAFDVMRFSIDRRETEDLTLPPRLATMWRYREADAVNAGSPRRFAITFDMGQFLLNGRTFEMNGVAPDEIMATNTLEVWEFDNDTGSMMTVVHPMHAHGRSFQVIEREVNPGNLPGWETVSAGYVDEGWNDVVMLMPGEKARVLVRTSRFPGLFLYHCHNLEHEDAGMMRNYRLDEARDVQLAVESSCPNGGPVRISWQGATPGGQAALLFSPREGDFIIPAGSMCSGTGLDLAPASLRIVYRGSAGADGSRTITGNAAPGACGGRLQLLDLGACAASWAAGL